MARSNTSRRRRSSPIPTLGALVLLASQASALSLANFQIITSSSTPLSCLLAYNAQIPACTATDFSAAARGICSAACVRGLLQTSGNVGQACAGVRAAPNSVLFQAARGGLIDTLCPNFARAGGQVGAAPVGAAPPAAATPLAQPPQAARPGAGSGVVVIPPPAGAAVTPVAVPAASPAPLPAAVPVASPVPLGPAALPLPGGDDGDGAGVVAANPPSAPAALPPSAPAAAETADLVAPAPAAQTPARGGGGVLSQPPAAGGGDVAQGGGSPFDFAVAAGADGLVAAWWKAAVVAVGVAIVIGQ